MSREKTWRSRDYPATPRNDTPSYARESCRRINWRGNRIQRRQRRCAAAVVFVSLGWAIAEAQTATQITAGVIVGLIAFFYMSRS